MGIIGAVAAKGLMGFDRYRQPTTPTLRYSASRHSKLQEQHSEAISGLAMAIWIHTNSSMLAMGVIGEVPAKAVDGFWPIPPTNNTNTLILSSTP